MLRSVLIALLIPSVLSAQGLDEADRARAAVNRGEILRLSKVLPQIQDQFGGVVLDTSLVRKGSAYAYEFSILTRDAHLIDIMVNAATGEVMAGAADRRTGISNHGGLDGRTGAGNGPDDDNDDNDNDNDNDDNDNDGDGDGDGDNDGSED